MEGFHFSDASPIWAYLARFAQVTFSGCGKMMDSNLEYPMSRKPLPEQTDRLITVSDFAEIARLSRRQIDRLRVRRSRNFPREYELGTGSSKYRRCPRFRLSEVQAWLDSRALW